MQTMQFSLLVLLSLFSDVLAYEVCSSYYGTYCNDGYTCCEDDTECCDEAALAIGGIVGMVIGIIIFISCCVGVICFIKKRNRPGHPSQQTGVPSISTVQHHGPPIHGQPMYGQPSYGQPSYGQPSYGQPHHGSQQTQGV